MGTAPPLPHGECCSWKTQPALGTKLLKRTRPMREGNWELRRVILLAPIYRVPRRQKNTSLFFLRAPCYCLNPEHTQNPSTINLKTLLT